MLYEVITTINVSVGDMPGKVGQIEVLDQGKSAITSFTLSGSGNENFTINSLGEIYLSSANDIGAYQNTWFTLIVNAFNQEGKSVDKILKVNVLARTPFLGDLSTYVDENAPVVV